MNYRLSEAWSIMHCSIKSKNSSPDVAENKCELHQKCVRFLCVIKIYRIIFKCLIDECTSISMTLSCYYIFSVCDLCHTFTNCLVETKQPIRGIELLKRAIRKIQLFDSQLTSVHADLYQLCLLSKCMKPALEFLDTDVTGISSEVSMVYLILTFYLISLILILTCFVDDFQQGGQNDSKHFLLCYYYGGMIYTAMKNYDRALYFFEVAITTPAVAVSHIMLEAYKKYILISLILHGKVHSALLAFKFLYVVCSYIYF